MSAFSDVFSAFKQVVLLQSRMDQLDSRMTRTAADIHGLTDALSTLRDRISRLEGLIEGAAMMSRQRRIEE